MHAEESEFAAQLWRGDIEGVEFTEEERLVPCIARLDPCCCVGEAKTLGLLRAEEEGADGGFCAVAADDQMAGLFGSVFERNSHAAGLSEKVRSERRLPNRMSRP